MADQSQQSIDIAASAADIMSVIGDFQAYPEWTGAVKTAEVLEEDEEGWAKQVHFVLDAGVVKDDYVLAYEWTDDTAVHWHLVKGQMQKSQVGSYVLRETGDTTNVTYTLTVDLAIPMLGMFKRKAEKVIMDTALKELKKRVEG
ncbi:MAG: SRPBCC family protein [Geodermatophilaceae bacterium]|nr:SRPBCC family protein [Geodermatophilaceae bacterium]